VASSQYFHILYTTIYPFPKHFVLYFPYLSLQPSQEGTAGAKAHLLPLAISSNRGSQSWGANCAQLKSRNKALKWGTITYEPSQTFLTETLRKMDLSEKARDVQYSHATFNKYE